MSCVRRRACAWPGGEPINNPSRNPPHPSVLVGGVGQRRGARPRLVQTQSWCPRDVGCRSGIRVANFFQFSSVQVADYPGPTRRTGAASPVSFTSTKESPPAVARFPPPFGTGFAVWLTRFYTHRLAALGCTHRLGYTHSESRLHTGTVTLRAARHPGKKTGPA